MNTKALSMTRILKMLWIFQEVTLKYARGGIPAWAIEDRQVVRAIPWRAGDPSPDVKLGPAV